MDPIRHISRMVYQAAYAASMITPARNSRVKRDRARRFAAKAEANAQKHAPAGIAVALNLLVMGFLGTVTVRRFEEKRAAMEVEMGLLVETHGNGKPPGGGGGSGSPALNPQVSAPTTPVATMAMLTSTAITPTFSVPTGTGITGVPSGLAHGTGSGNGTGTGNGSGTGSGTGSGNGSGVGNGNGNGKGSIDNRIPVILLHMGRETNHGRTPGWNTEESVKEWDKAMATVKSQFRITDQIECGETILCAHIEEVAGEYPDHGVEGMLRFKDSTASHLVEAVNRNTEAKAIVFLASWDDTYEWKGPSPASVAELINILKEHHLPMVLFNYMVPPKKNENRLEIEVSEGSGGGGATYSRLQETVAKAAAKATLPQVPPQGTTPDDTSNKSPNHKALKAIIPKLREKGVNPTLLAALMNMDNIPTATLERMQQIAKGETPP